MKQQKISDFIPWHDSRKWESGKCYPVPHSDEADFDGKKICTLGASWGVYKLDPSIEKGSSLWGDYIPVVHGVHMKDACMIANSLNEEM